ncbi:hypothetical protein ACIBFB_19965 [Nocardiopsis sp. NPDC050513]|uniref:hypothetical protein n=1 Tax=Nocardiopsis sp. NPDC050513 TaxID=3364338 RepID=UPI00378E1A0F
MAEWLRNWLDTRTRLRPRTRVGYAEHIDRYLIPYLGGVLLGELTPALVRQAFDAISHHTTPAGDRLSPVTVQRVRATLRAALNTAVRERLLSSTPARGLRLDSGQAARPVVWTDQVVAAWRNGGERPAGGVDGLAGASGRWEDGSAYEKVGWSAGSGVGPTSVPPWTHRRYTFSALRQYTPSDLGFCGAPGRIRTCGHRMRSRYVPFHATPSDP